MKKLLTVLGIVVLVLALDVMLLPAQVARASTDIYVPSLTYPTIQSGIDAASAGDTVHVAADTYNERITLKDGVKLLGAGAGVTTIDGSGVGPVVTANGVSSTTRLDGFTITNGSSPFGAGTDSFGGGMYNVSSSPTVTNCTFSGNSATYGGGISNEYSSSPTVTNCTFSGNSASYGGGYPTSTPPRRRWPIAPSRATRHIGAAGYSMSGPPRRRWPIAPSRETRPMAAAGL